MAIISKEPSHPEEKKKGVYKNFISGGISATIARTLINPIERLEILRQVDNIDYKGVNIVKSIKKFYQTQGIKGLFKGNSAAIIRILPFSAIEFYSFEFYKNLFIRGRPERQNSFLYTLLCGALTGLNAITLTFPLDVARTRLACVTFNSNVKDENLRSSLAGLYKNEGIRGLFKGYSVTFIGSIPFVALKQTLFDFFKTNYMIDKHRSKLNFAFGSLSGVIATTLLYPTHMIKRVFQANNDKNLRISTWVVDNYRKYGITHFYKGMSINYLKTIPYQGLLFWTNEKLKILLGYEVHNKHM